MNDALAQERLNGVLELIDRWGDFYERRWGYRHPQGQPYPALEQQVKEGIDEVRKRTRLAHDVIVAIGENELAAKVVEHEEGSYGGHPFSQARVAIVEAIAILTHREELAEIVGPVGPQLSASKLHPVIWGAGAALWDDGHFPQAVSDRCQGPRRATASKIRCQCVGREPRQSLFNEQPDARIATSSTS